MDGRQQRGLEIAARCQVLCHNLVVLVHEIHELDIDPVFWGHGAEQAA